MYLKKKLTFTHFKAVIPGGLKSLSTQNWFNSQPVSSLFTRSSYSKQNIKRATGTHLLNEAMHGLGYGSCIGLGLGVYILFCPLWITLSPAWYTKAPWYTILLITTLACMLLMGCGAAALGANVLDNNNNKPTRPKETKN
jgi:hypothetical protein